MYRSFSRFPFDISLTGGAEPAPVIELGTRPARRGRGSGARTGASRRAQPATGALRILIVEDDFLVAAEIEAALAEEGYATTTARSAEDALPLARDERPDLAIMDIRLAGPSDGISAALDILKETGIRCIFATAHHDAATRARANAAAPLGWLAKPYATATLVSLVEAALGTLGKK